MPSKFPLLALLVVIGLLGSMCADGVAAEEKFDLTVLYAGVKEDPRTQNWVDFLGKHFQGVRTIDLPQLSKITVGDADVVIVDSPTPYQEKFQMPKVPRLGLDFTKPTLLMGAAGGSVLGGLRIKLNWL